MTSESDAELTRAFDAASGRTDESGVDAEWLAAARRVLAARRRTSQAEACPQAVRRRIESLFSERAPSLGERLALVYDSLTAPAVATRGPTATRTLRFEAKGHALDVRLSQRGDDWLLQVAWTGAQETPRIYVQLLPGGETVEIPLQDDGVGRHEVPARFARIVLALHLADGRVILGPRVRLA